MDCHAHLDSASQQIQLGDAAGIDLPSLVKECPQICDYVYGTADFDFAGTGVFFSLAVQAILYLVFGTLLSFISYILPLHAKSSTRLTVARLQVVFDTVYSTGNLIHLATLIATFVRLRQDAGVFERNIIQSMLDIQATLQAVAMIAYMIQRVPATIKPRAQGWGFMTVWLTSQPLILAGHYLKARSGWGPATAITKLCRASAPTDHPYISTPPSGNTYLLIFIGTIVFTILILIVNEYIRSTIWTWIMKIFGSRIMAAIGVTLWTLCTLTALGMNSYFLFYEREAMLSKTASGGPAWDLGQVLVLVVWLPAAWLMVLTFLLSLKGLNLWLDLFLILVQWICKWGIVMSFTILFVLTMMRPHKCRHGAEARERR